MRNRLILSLILVGVLVTPVVVLGQDSEGASSKPLLQLLFGWAPFIFIIVLWMYFMRRIGGKKVGTQVERSLQHMDRLERQNEEILETLRRIEVGLRERR